MRPRMIDIAIHFAPRLRAKLPKPGIWLFARTIAVEAHSLYFPGINANVQIEPPAGTFVAA